MSKTLILLGNGSKKYSHQLNEFIIKYNLPIVYSLNGKGIISDYNSNNLGMIGWKGNKYANQCLNECEELIVIGSRLDIRQIPDKSILNFKKIRLIDTNYQFPIANPCHLETFLKDFDSTVSICNKKRINQFNSLETVIHHISLKMKEYTLVTDVGENQMVCANAWYADSKNKFITSGGLGTMGFAISGAIGVAVNNVPVVAICGDGGFQMSISELETIKHNKLKVKIIIINNHQLKLVADFQKEMNLECVSTIKGYSCPSIKKIVNAYGIRYFNSLFVDEFIKYSDSAILELKITP